MGADPAVAPTGTPRGDRLMAGPVLLTPPVTRWWCPSCGGTDVTREHLPHTRMHPCPRLGGLVAPMVPEGTSAMHVPHEREDYIAGEQVALDDAGRPVMSVTTTRDDGEDCTVYAPAASASSDQREG